MPWFIKDETDYVLLEEVLRAGIEVSEKLKSHKPEELGFSIFSDEIPLLVPEQDGFIWKSCHVPEIMPEVFASPVLSDELTEVSEIDGELLNLAKENMKEYVLKRVDPGEDKDLDEAEEQEDDEDLSGFMRFLTRERFKI